MGSWLDNFEVDTMSADEESQLGSHYKRVYQDGKNDCQRHYDTNEDTYFPEKYADSTDRTHYNNGWSYREFEILHGES